MIYDNKFILFISSYLFYEIYKGWLLGCSLKVTMSNKENSFEFKVTHSRHS
jgi:hypothetical protein